MCDRLHQSDVGIQNILKNVFCVAGSANTQNLERRTLRFDLHSKLLEYFNRILNRIAVRKLVGLAKNVPFFFEHGSFGRSRPCINSDETGDDLPWIKLCRVKLLLRVGRLEGYKLSILRNETFAPGSCFFLCTTIVNVVEKLFGAEIAAHPRLFLFSEFDRSQRCKVLRIVGYFDQLFRSCSLWNLDLPFFPHAGDVGLPGLLHAANKPVWSAQKKNMRPQCMSAGQHAEILQHNCLEERGHQLIRGRTGFLQTVNVGFCEDTTLTGDLVQLDTVISLIRKVCRGDLELGIDLVDDSSGTACALVVHGGDLLLAPRLRVIFEDDDLRILSAQFDDGVDLRMKLFDGKRDGMHLLNKLRADHLGDGSTT